MRAGKASRTAELSAAYRALDTSLNAEPILGDPFAGRMVRLSWRIPVQSSVVRALYFRFVMDLRPAMITFTGRSRIAEDVLAAKAEQGPVQWVLLGAGLDTFAWRHPEHAAVPQFELDHPDTQTHKRAEIERLGLRAPEAHRFVPIDFEQTSIPDALAGAGFDRDIPAVFAWLGVTYYLTRDAITRTLADVASIAAPGSALIFDYRLPDSYISERDRPIQKRGDAAVAKWGEPHMSKLEPAEWPPLAAATGWRVESDIGDDVLSERFARVGTRALSNYRIATLARGK
jgi:methyltransferase (TIGR00027 family)